MSYVDEVIELVEKKNPGEPEFHQAVKEVLESLKQYKKKSDTGGKSCHT